VLTIAVNNHGVVATWIQVIRIKIVVDIGNFGPRQPPVLAPIGADGDKDQPASDLLERTSI